MIAETIDLLTKLRNYMDKRADWEFDGKSEIPNEELIFLDKIDDFLKEIQGEEVPGGTTRGWVMDTAVPVRHE